MYVTMHAGQSIHEIVNPKITFPKEIKQNTVLNLIVLLMIFSIFEYS